MDIAAEPTNIVGRKSKRTRLSNEPLRLVLPAGVVDMTSMSKARVSIKMMSKTEIYARPVPKTKVAKGSKRKVSDVAKVQGEGSQRRYPEKVKRAIAKMAIERGDRSSAKYFSKELGFEVHPITVKRFKKAFPCNQKKKRGEEQEEGENSQDDEEEEHIEGGEENIQGGEDQVNGDNSNTQLQVQQVNTNQEQEEIIIDANEEVNGEGDEIQDQVNTGEGSIAHNQEIISDGNKVEEELNQVKEQMMEDEEEDEDLIVHFDPRSAYKETPAIAIMKKYVELERKIQMRKKEAQLLQMEKEELSKKLAEELAK